MSKENFLGFLRQVSDNKQLREQVKSANSPAEIVELGKKHGHEFEPEQVEASVTEIRTKPGAFQYLSEAVLEIFSPTRDNYPVTGVQPFEGRPNRGK